MTIRLPQIKGNSMRGQSTSLPLDSLNLRFRETPQDYVLPELQAILGATTTPTPGSLSVSNDLLSTPYNPDITPRYHPHHQQSSPPLNAPYHGRWLP